MRCPVAESSSGERETVAGNWSTGVLLSLFDTFTYQTPKGTQLSVFYYVSTIISVLTVSAKVSPVPKPKYFPADLFKIL